jgi:phosphatidylglycerophosphate synthase
MALADRPATTPAPVRPFDRKESRAWLRRWDAAIVATLVPRVPAWIQTQHLTLATLGWSALVVMFSVWARDDRRWLWAASFVIVAQYLTDTIDGKVGQLRRSGLVRWGYYVDHFLDYVFLAAILTGYVFIAPPTLQWMFVPLLAVASGFMVSAFLAKPGTGVLTISFLGFGPNEIRLVFLAINAIVATVGRAVLLTSLPYVIAGAAAVLALMVFRTQHRLWRLDRGELS